jgi:hypothetical protein
MKKFWFSAILLFSIFANVAIADNKANLSGKIIIEDSSNYFLLSDGTCWQVLGFQIRTRGFVEWWHGVQLITPDKCDCKPNDWVLGSEVEAYTIRDSQKIDISNAENIESLKNCTHYLVNAKNGQILFGTSLLPADCMVKIYNEAATPAYNRGYTAGFSAGQQISQQFVSDAYSRGYTAGYLAGQQHR